MKFLILFAIRMYQVFIPKRFRGRCLFKESCSHHVYRITKEAGFQYGINALKFRLKNCKPNYFIIESKGQILLITAQNEIIEEEFIAQNIIIRDNQKR